MKRILAFLSFAIMAVGVNSASAQWSVGPHILISIPQSEFENVTETGGGFGIKALKSFRGFRGFAIRSDFAFLTYGRDRSFNAFGEYIETRKEGMRLTAGPSYTFGSESFRIHTNVGAGFHYYRTSINYFLQFGSFQDSRDNNLALGWNAGIGVQFDIGLGPFINAEFEYQSVYDLPAQTGEEADGTPIIEDIDYNEYTIKVGVIFFLGR